MNIKKSSGILMPITSLPSKYGIGCFSHEAYEFTDKLKKAGQSVWQILPIGPTGFGDSPYQSFSTFAGNPYMISLEDLISEGVLSRAECESEAFRDGSIDYGHLYRTRYTLLKKAYERSNIESNQNYLDFTAENAWWLEDYAAFFAIKNKYCGKPWYEWDIGIRMKEKSIEDKYRKELSGDIDFCKYIQYKFFEQWYKLKKYANEKGIKIVGDLPIYVSYDSADVWANPQLFMLDGDTPVNVAGCPPDGFAPEGQLWGNPVYDWEYHDKTDYEWWISRIEYSFRLYDILRIDHFRGFDEYYSIPYGSKNAVNGKWEKGPGMKLFNQMKQTIGSRDIIAEDLGYVTDSVRRLVKDTGFMNMKVLEFAFDSRDTGSANDYLPHNYGNNCAAYTGTHDNQTLASWINDISAEELKLVRGYLCDEYTPQKELNLPLISLLMRSNAALCIIPIQDYLGLDDKSRINTPSTLGINWKWRLKPGELTDDIITLIGNISRRYGRFNA